MEDVGWSIQRSKARAQPIPRPLREPLEVSLFLLPHTLPLAVPHLPLVVFAFICHELSLKPTYAMSGAGDTAAADHMEAPAAPTGPVLPLIQQDPGLAGTQLLTEIPIGPDLRLQALTNGTFNLVNQFTTFRDR